MGTFSVPIEIGDLLGRQYVRVDALAGTGAALTSVPASLLAGLGVSPTRRGRFALADGQRVELDMGETKLRVNGMETYTWVLFGAEGSQPLLGDFLGALALTSSTDD